MTRANDLPYLFMCWLALRPRLTVIAIVAGVLVAGLLEEPKL